MLEINETGFSRPKLVRKWFVHIKRGRMVQKKSTILKSNVKYFKNLNYEQNVQWIPSIKLKHCTHTHTHKTISENSISRKSRSEPIRIKEMMEYFVEHHKIESMKRRNITIDKKRKPSRNETLAKQIAVKFLSLILVIVFAR